MKSLKLISNFSALLLFLIIFHGTSYPFSYPLLPLLLLQINVIRASISFINVFINKIVALIDLPHIIPKPSYTAMVVSYIL